MLAKSVFFFFCAYALSILSLLTYCFVVVLYARHTHDLVDQVFSRFSTWLNDHNALSLDELAKALTNAFTPAVNVVKLDRSVDVKSWLGEACPGSGHVEGVTAPHYFVIEEDPALVERSLRGQGMMTTGIRHAEWTHTELSPYHHLLQAMPTAAPEFLPGRHLFYRDGRSQAAMDKMLKAMEDQVRSRCVDDPRVSNFIWSLSSHLIVYVTVLHTDIEVVPRECRCKGSPIIFNSTKR